jgi:predicted AAA+ superfamily ATPase
MFYYRGQQECDFVIKRGTRPTTAIQVSYQLHDQNRDRELRGLVEAMSEFNLKDGFVLTYNDEDKMTYKNHTIRILPVWKWLLATR